MAHYEILGSDLQALDIELKPGDGVIAEAGSMCWVDDGVVFQAKMGDGTDPHAGIFGKTLSAIKRDLTGSGIFLTHFTNPTGHPKHVAFAAPYPGKIVRISMAEMDTNLICQKDAFLCATLGTHLGLFFNRRLGSGFFGGNGFILQKIVGHGNVFIHAGGTLIVKELHGETLRVDPGCLAAFTEGLEYSIQRAGNLKTMFFGGDGLFLATLRGHGKVYLQTMPLARLADRIAITTDGS